MEGTPWWVTALTALVAVYGAGLSTWQAVANWRAKVRPLKVSVSVGMGIFGPELSEPWMIFDIANPRVRSAKIQSPFLYLPDGKRLQFFELRSEHNFPCTLESEHDTKAWVPIKNVAKSLKEQGYSGTIKLKPCVKDALDKEHIGDWVDLDLDGWVK